LVLIIHNFINLFSLLYAGEATMKEEKIGVVFSYYSNIGVAAVMLEKPLKVGDKIRIKGTTTDVVQQVTSMQIEHTPVKEAKKGIEIGLKVADKVRQNDIVYRIV